MAFRPLDEPEEQPGGFRVLNEEPPVQPVPLDVDIDIIQPEQFGTLGTNEPVAFIPDTTPVAEAAVIRKAKTGTRVIKNSIQRGLLNAQLAREFDVDEPNPEAVAAIIQQQSEIPISPAMKAFNEAESFSDAVAELAKNPTVIIPELIAESSAAQIPILLEKAPTRVLAGATIGAGFAAAAGQAGPQVAIPEEIVTVPALAAKGAQAGLIESIGETSLLLERSGSIISSLAESGVDVTDAKSLEAAFMDKEKMREVKRRALAKGIPIAVLDGLSAGLAGRLFAKPATTMIGKLGHLGVELLTQMGLGAGGEVIGEVAAGEEISPSAILGEAVAELGSGPAEISVSRITDAIAANKALRKAQGIQDQTIAEKAPVEPEIAPEAVEEVVTPTPEEEVTVEPPPIPEPVAEEIVEEEAFQPAPPLELPPPPVEVVPEQVGEAAVNSPETTSKRAIAPDQINVDQGTAAPGETVETVEDPNQKKAIRTNLTRGADAVEGSVRTAMAEDKVTAKTRADLGAVGAGVMARGITDEGAWNTAMKAKFGEEVVDLLPQAREEATRIYNQGARTHKTKMRGFAKRISEAQEFTELSDEVRKRPGNFYETQNMEDITERVGVLSNEELALEMNKVQEGIPVESRDNTSVMAGIELINRKKAEGDTAAVNQIIETVSTQLTTAAQMMRQAAELRTTTPEGLTVMFEQTLKKLGRQMSEADSQTHLALAEADINARRALKDADAIFKESPTEENAGLLQDAARNSELASQELLRFQARVTPKNFSQLLQQFLQGNLMVPLSQIRNIMGNLTVVPLRFGYHAVASGADTLYSSITRQDKTIARLRPTAWLKAMPRALQLGITQLITGVPVGQGVWGEKSLRGFQPFTSLKQFATGEQIALTEQGKVAVTDRLKKLLEGVFGMAPEVTFRFLTLGDVPFREAFKSTLIDEQIRLRKLKGDEARRFRVRQEIKPTEQIRLETLESVFQQDNFFVQKVLNPIFNTLQKSFLGGGGALFLRTQVPFAQTPTNLAWEGAQFASPELSLVLAAQQFKQGNRRRGMQQIGKAAIGYMMLQGSFALMRAGLLTGDPERDKETRLRYASFRPNRLNISGLRRWMDGDDPEWRPGDETIEYKYLGYAGIVMNVVANKGDELMRSGKDVEQANLGLPFATMATELPAALMQMTMMKGAFNFLQAINNKEYDKWVTDTWNAMLAIPIPNTISAISRTTQENIPSSRAVKELQSPFERAVREKFGLTDDWPVIRDIYGRKVARTPEGRNPITYQNLDVLRLAYIPQDPIVEEVSRVFDQTRDSRVIPSEVKNFFTQDNKKVELTPEQADVFTEMVGKERLKLTEKLFDKKRYGRLSMEEKAKAIGKANRDGRSRAKKDFVREFDL